MQTIDVLGAPASPYTRKVLALLRYRRIPYRVLWGSHIDPPAGYPAPKVKLLPTVYTHTGAGCEAWVDSTPIIQQLEALHTDRSVQPDDDVLQFLNLLIEDFADEWLTKAMFHYRWHFPADAAHAAPYIAYSHDPQFSAADAKAMADAFSKRQIARLPLVGSNLVTAPVIEASFQRLVGILDRIIERQGFVLGTRPATADFALYGQLTQLGIIDPTPAQSLAQASPRLRAWLDRMEDLSGHDDNTWIDPSHARQHLGELLAEIGRVYTPFLLANAQAASQGQADVETLIDNQRWTQPVFPYQLKCLDILQHARLQMTEANRMRLDDVLVGSGCQDLFR